MKTDRRYIERYRGMIIFKDRDGYTAQNGPDYAADNEETLDDARNAIERYWKSMSEDEPRDDSPSLGEPWWHHR